MENSNHLLQVGEFVLNTSSRKLFDSHNNEVSLSPTLYTLLKFFIEHQNQILTRDMIRNSVWKGKIVVDANVNQNIKKLRDTLGDSVADPKYIETVTGEGFRFVANSEEYKAVPFENNKTLIWGAVLVVFLVILFNFFSTNSNQRENTKFLELFPLTSLKGVEHYPAVSHDSKFVLFSYKNESRWDIYLRPLNKESYVPIVESPNKLRFPRLSFGDERLLYFEKGKDICGLFIRNIKLEEARVGEAQEVKRCNNPDSRIRGVWKSSNELFISVNEDLHSPASIYYFNLDSKVQTLISKPDSKGFGDYSLNYSKELKKLVYIRNIGWSSSEIWVYDIGSQQHSKIKSLPMMLTEVSWDKEGYIYYASGHRELSRILYTGDSEEVVGKFSRNIYLPFAIDESRLGIMTGEYSVVDVSVFDMRQKVIRNAVSSSYNDYRGARGGNLLAFVSNRSGEHQVWIRDVSGTDRQLTNFKGSFEIQSLSVSPDGNYIMCNKSGRTVIIDVEGKVIFNSEDYSNQVHYNPVIDSANQRFLYSTQYQSEWNIEYRTFDELGQRVTMFEGLTARPCAFGDCLLYFKENDPFLYRYDPGSNSSSKLIEIANIIDSGEWDVYGESSILYLEKNEKNEKLNRIILVDLTDGSKKVVLETKSKSFTFDQDKKLIYTNVVAQGSTELMYLYK